MVFRACPEVVAQKERLTSFGHAPVEFVHAHNPIPIVSRNRISCFSIQRSLRDEPFDFRFPGVQLDFARRAFFAKGRRGELIQVARFRDDPVPGSIDLAPGAKIYLLKESGRVTAILTATDYPRGEMRWIEMDDNFSLQSLLVALLRELGVHPDS